MNDEDERAHLQREIDRAHQAERIFGNALFEAAVSDIRDRILRQFAEAATDKDRLEAQSRLLGLNSVLGELRTHVETGKMARSQMDVWRERMKRGFRGSAVA